MPDRQSYADVQEARAIATSQMRRLEATGLEQNEFGEYRAEGVIRLYPVGSDYEVDITLPAGGLSFDIPRRAVHVTAGPGSPPPPFSITYDDWLREQAGQLPLLEDAHA